MGTLGVDEVKLLILLANTSSKIPEAQLRGCQLLVLSEATMHSEVIISRADYCQDRSRQVFTTIQWAEIDV
jgi:hypothetical protein